MNNLTVDLMLIELGKQLGVNRMYMKRKDVLFAEIMGKIAHNQKRANMSRAELCDAYNLMPVESMVLAYGQIAQPMGIPPEPTKHNTKHKTKDNTKSGKVIEFKTIH
jgi:hypothetical protein